MLLFSWPQMLCYQLLTSCFLRLAQPANAPDDFCYALRILWHSSVAARRRNGPCPERLPTSTNMPARAALKYLALQKCVTRSGTATKDFRVMSPSWEG